MTRFWLDPFSMPIELDGEILPARAKLALGSGLTAVDDEENDRTVLELTLGVSLTPPITITNTDPSEVPLTVKGAAAQAAHVQDWKNSSGTVIAAITPSGGVFFTALGAGVVHADASGNLSSSAIVNADITSVAWSKITGAPTTLAGFGITDGVPSSRTITVTAPILIDGGSSANLSANRTISISNASTSALGAIKLAQDLGGTGLLPTVIAISGGGAGGNAPIHCDELLFDAARTPAITHFPTSGENGRPFTITAQSTDGSHVGGPLVLVCGGGASSEGIQLFEDATQIAQFRSAGTDSGRLFLGTGAPAAGNYVLDADGANDVTINTPTGKTVHFAVNNLPILKFYDAGAVAALQSMNSYGLQLNAHSTVQIIFGVGAAGTVTFLDGQASFATIMTVAPSAITAAKKLVTTGGRRRGVTDVNLTTNYTVLATDEVICITGLSGASKTINLPASPTVGDTYVIKDSAGNVSVDSTLVLSGNGHNIDAVASKTISDTYVCVEVTYMNGAWALMNYEKTNLGS